MRGELVITERELQTRFRGERDLVTLAPYQVGDRVIRCGNCHAVVKTQFVTAGGCPLCGHAPFTPSPVINEPSAYVAPSRTQRGIRGFFGWLILSAASSLLPFIFPGMRSAISDAMFGLSVGWIIAIFCALSLISLLVLMCNDTITEIWQNSEAGRLLAFIPGAVPYAALCSLWLVIIVVKIILAILLIGLCIAAVIGLIGGLSN